jgi:hypothetical protein
MTFMATLVLVNIAFVLGFPSKKYYLIPTLFAFNILVCWAFLKFLALPIILFPYA